MREYIISEVKYFEICIFSGFILAMSYDFFRILRIVVKHKKYVVFIQDIIYGVFIGIYFFSINQQYNSGIIRIFVFMPLILGIFLYLKLFSNSVVSIFAIIFKKIRNYILKILTIVEKITINICVWWEKLLKFRKL